MRLDRRTLLAGLSTTPAWALRAASAQEAARFSALRVDTQPLADRGAVRAAEAIAAIMPAKMQLVFADLVSPATRSLPVLVARIDTIYLPDFAGNRPGYIFAYQQDTLSGAGLIVRGRQVESVTPLHVNLPPDYSGAYYLPDIDTRRIDSISYQFAYWLRREMSL